jgi:hypothetical protein
MPTDDHAAASGALPPDLLNALRKYGHLIPQSWTINLVMGSYDAPSDTASAMTAEQWMHAWVAEWQRANRAEVELEELRESIRLRDEQRRPHRECRCDSWP